MYKDSRWENIILPFLDDCSSTHFALLGVLVLLDFNAVAIKESYLLISNKGMD